MTETYPRWIGGVGWYYSNSRTWHGSCSLFTAPGKVERSAKCKHAHRSYDAARACGDRMAARRKLP